MFQVVVGVGFKLMVSVCGQSSSLLYYTMLTKNLPCQEHGFHFYFFLFLCDVCIHIYVYGTHMHMPVDAHACVCTEIIRGCQVSCSITSHLIPMGCDCSPNPEFTISARLIGSSVSSRDPLVSASQFRVTDTEGHVQPSCG